MNEKKKVILENLSDNKEPDTFIEKDISKSIKNEIKKEEKNDGKKKISDIDFV